MRKNKLLVYYPLKRGLLLLLFVLTHAMLVHAQNVLTLKGKVTDASGFTSPGVTVQLKGNSSVGTVTDDKGAFTLALPAGVTSGTLVLSYVTSETKEVSFTGDGFIQVSLANKSNDLNQVVVIGYGSAKQGDLASSITKVNSEDFNPGAVGSADDLLVGKVAGVVVTSNGGAPGAGSSITIRGVGTIGLTTQPLYVIDGVPLSQGATIAGVQDPLSTIDPNDIESMTVLKDAAATAIYGNRGANGVVIVTTKSGKKGGKLQVALNSTTSVSQVTKYTDVLNGNQVRSFVDQYGTPAQQALLGTANTDWQKQIYQNAVGINDDVSFTGGIKNLPYRLSLGYYGQDGILKTGYLKRESVGLSLTPTFLHNSLKVTVNFNGSHQENRFANTAAIGDAARFDPTQPVYSGNSKFGGYYTWLEAGGIPQPLATSNPLADLNFKRDFSSVYRGFGNIQVEYALPALPELKAVVNTGGDITTSAGSTWTSPDFAGNYTSGGSFDNYKEYDRNAMFDFYLNYRKYFKKIKSSLDLTAGTDYQDFRTYAPATVTYYTIQPTQTGSPDSTEYTLFSEFARLSYVFNDKYVLNASVRNDYSSKVIVNNHEGVFSSVSAAWKINQENFLKNSTVLSDLKLRGSVGQSGNQNINPYQYLPNYYVSQGTALYNLGGQNYTALIPGAYNANIKWETTTATNLALDYGFLKNRITGTIEYYYRKATDLLVQGAPVSALSNLSNVITENEGEMYNKGVEFTINAIPVKTRDMQWNVGFNIAYNKNQVTKLYGAGAIVNEGTISGGTGNTIQANIVGQPVNSFYAYQQVYAANGTPIEGLYAEQKGGVLTYSYKSPNPYATIGFSTQFIYKKWSLFTALHGSFGNYVYNNVESNLGTQNAILNSIGFIGNASPEVLYSKFANSQYLSDYYIQNASFVRMDNLTISYNFGRIANRKLGLKVSAICQNVFVITKYTGLDPEIASGIDNNIYPKPRIYSLGINLNF